MKGGIFLSHGRHHPGKDNNDQFKGGRMLYDLGAGIPGYFGWESGCLVDIVM